MSKKDNPKRNIKKAEEKNNPQKNIEKSEDKKMFIITLISLIIAALGIIVAIASLLVQWITADREYEYKIPPEIETQGDVSLDVHFTENKNIVGINDVSFIVEEENNLRNAYLIEPDFMIEKLDLSVKDGSLSERTGKEMKLGDPDISINGIDYFYKFLVFQGLDNSYSLNLVYSKYNAADNELTLQAVTGIEVLEFERGYKDDPKYEGERIMAQKYKEMQSYCENYF